MVISIFSWYFCTLVVALAALPLAYRLLANLPERGAALARPLGLLVWGFIFWLAGSLNLIQNTIGGALLAFILLLAISAFLINGHHQDYLAWLRSRIKYLLTSEILFLILFVFWALVRAADPAISGTEKPMEMAFINAILHSPNFPPQDPWLSGYSISYYYFGYVIIAMIIRATGVLPSVAFNLAAALWFAMIAMAAYGLVINLIAACSEGAAGKLKPKWMAWSAMGPVFLLIVSNLEGFLEILHSRGIFWQQGSGGTWHSSFWKWLDLQELVNPPAQPFSWVPERVGGIWWWRASRVIQDYNLAGQNYEVIDEFPFFSFYLADLHPHVLAMPFVLLAVALALNLYLLPRERLVSGSGLFSWLRSWLRGEPAEPLRSVNWLRGLEFWSAALVFGGLSFLNTWDFPIYVCLFSAVYVYRVFQVDGWNMARIWEFIELCILVGAAGIMLYLPFYLGFSSQAGGILPSLSFFSRGVHFWIMFGSLLIPIVLWLVWMLLLQRKLVSLRQGLVFAILLVGGLWVFSFLLAWLASSLTVWGNTMVNAGKGDSLLINLMTQAGSLFAGLHGASKPDELIFSSLLKRLAQPGTWLTLFILAAVVWTLMAVLKNPKCHQQVSLSNAMEDRSESGISVDGFVLLLVLAGAVLTLVPEFFYLRDQFGWRINTIFKFYFQAWILWSLAAAYASFRLWTAVRSRWHPAVLCIWGVLLLMALVYPFFSLQMRFSTADGKNMTLDGAAFLQHNSPDDYAAISWLAQAPYGVVSEAVGGSYSSFARVSTHSGLPTVIGWPGHESQWRGGSTEIGSREADIERLYRTPSWEEAKIILDQYNIRYVFIGGLERSTYRVIESKFQRYMKPVFQSNMVVIYEIIPDSGAAAPSSR